MSQGRGQTGLQRMGEVLKKTYVADPVYSTDTLTRFYDRKEQLTQASTDYKQTKVKGPNFNEAQLKRFNKAADDISELSKKIRAVNADQGIAYDQKQAQVRALKQRQNEIAERVVGQ